MPKPSRVRRRIKKQYSRGGPNPIDIHIGARVRLPPQHAWHDPGSAWQDDRGTYRQLQKYEPGAKPPVVFARSAGALELFGAALSATETMCY